MNGKLAHLRSVRAENLDVAVTLIDALPAPLPAAEYLASFVRAQRCAPFRRPKLELVFEIVSTVAGDPVPKGTHASLWCPLGRNGTIRPSSKWARTWSLIACRSLRRGERMSTGILRGKLLRVAVRTVTTDHSGRDLPAPLGYSVIDRIVAVAVGGSGRPS